MHPVFIHVLLLFVASVVGTTFISPGPSGSNIDPSIATTIHPVSSIFHIAWDNTILTKKMSVVLFQYNETGKSLVYPFEDATRK